MRISILLDREPFGEIFEKTLSGFLESFYGQFYKVTWRKAFSFASPNSNSQIWLCNPYLNAIFVEGVHRKTLMPVIREFSRSEKWWRRPFQKIYVNLSTKERGCKWFAPYIVEVSPPLKNTENLLILGGNHHIRLLDYNEGVTFVIHKDGFEKGFVNNEINVRKENPYLPCPVIRDIAKDGSWYSEELILGTPINRLEDEEKAERVVRDVMKPLFQLYEKTARKVKICKYVSEIINRIEVCMEKNLCLEQKMRENVNNEILALNKIIGKYQRKEIIIAQTHGDFQPANILFGEELAWLIDWEYTAERQIAYDALVFDLKARTSRGFGRRVIHAINDNLECDKLLSRFPYVQWQDGVERCVLLALFMLEEIELKIMEFTNPLFFSLDRGFNVFIEELNCAIRGIEGLC